jgi:hypothetical protein
VWEDGERPEEPDDPAALDEPPEDDPGQLSLFEVHSSHVVDGEGALSTFDDDPDVDALDAHVDADVDLDDGYAIELPAPPPPGAGRYTGGLPEDLAGRPLAEVKAELRAANADLARDLARYTGLSHREVNGRLNRLASVERIAEATVDQLRRRAAHAERWLGGL